MKKIPSNVQSLLSSSNLLNNHSKAIEELVYNALDAGATSIAIRVNIQENTIQVIDNGCGISKKDFKPLGQKYMSSKVIDHSTLRSVPDKYGFRGEALSSLINVSKSVKLISHHEKSKETWLKLFEHGQEKILKEYNPRPSKGTTVEITGFLYNLNIQNKLKDTLHNLQNIKSFLEHISLVHCNVSLSLRDDSRNEILFKIHKNRNVAQTLSELYNIEKKNLQELQVEKNEYKVKAHISNSDSQVGRQLIFLNGKLVQSSSKLHKVVNSNLSKYFNQRCSKNSKIKDKITEEENHLIQKSLPDYFIFIKCPYTDYELSHSGKQSVLEFKDWNQINRLLEKLVKFYNGDMKLKEVTKEEQMKVISNKPENRNTREQVKQIMQRILGTNTKKTGIMNLQNGIRGKQITRKSRKMSTTKVKNKENNFKDKLTNNNATLCDSLNNETNLNIFVKSNDAKECNHPNSKLSHETKKYSALDRKEKSMKSRVGNKYNMNFKKVVDKKKAHILHKMETKKHNIDTKNSRIKKSKDKKKEVQSPSNFIKNRYEQLHRNTMQMLDQWHKNNFNKIREENSEGNNLDKKQINVSIRRQIDEIIIHNNKSKQPRTEVINVKKKLVQSNYDLIQTILTSQSDNNRQRRNTSSGMDMIEVHPIPVATRVNKYEENKIINKKLENKQTEPIVTYESHNYYSRQSVHTESKSNNSYQSHVQIHKRKRTFITRQSRDNFVMPNEHPKRNLFKRKNFRTRIPTAIRAHIKNLFRQTSKLFNLKKQIVGTTCESSYRIEFTESNKFRSSHDRAIMSHLSQNTRMNIEEIRSQSLNLNNAAKDNDIIAMDSGTCVLSNVDGKGYNVNDENYNDWALHGTYTIESIDKFTNGTGTQYQVSKSKESSQNKRNFIFVSKSQKPDQYNETIDPLNVCETILNSEEVIAREFEISFKNRSNCLFNNANDANKQDFIYQNNISMKQDENMPGILEVNNDCQNMITGVSHHFECPKDTNKVPIDLNNGNSSYFHDDRPNSQDADLNDANKKSLIPTTAKPDIRNKTKITDAKKYVDESNGDFNFKNRLCFVPKGLSPIFQNCKTKDINKCNLSRDYYEKELYNNFAVNVRNNAEVYEQNIQGHNEVNTKAIEKVNIKLVKEKSALKFDGKSLKDATVFRQIDDKFIAATMKESRNYGPLLDYLVLFDQHAVHERIRLEDNLEDYFKENQWKSTPVDNVTLKLSKDDVLYLHNFKDKFEQLGLQWTVINGDKVCISSIPEAIIGKNPRQVEKVIKAVNKLIVEEINVIKIQGGCVSLYPKSIMDLVFSEPSHRRYRAEEYLFTANMNYPQQEFVACRYAIKFGDKLSKTECMELLKTLSRCKTPFQCAHGRPVMAVVMEIKPNVPEYKININKILEWKNNKPPKI